MKASDVESYKAYVPEHTIYEVMEFFHCTKGTVHNRNKKYGLTCKKAPKTYRYPKALKLLPTGYAETHTVGEIARYLEVSTASVYLWRKRFGLKTRNGHNKGTDTDRNTMIKYLSKEFTYDAIGREFNLSKQRVEQIIHK